MKEKVTIFHCMEVFLFILSLSVIGFLIYSYKNYDPNDSSEIYKQSVKRIFDGWELEGQQEDVVFPVKLLKEKTVLLTTFPGNIDNKDYLSFCVTSANVKVFVDGEQRYSYVHNPKVGFIKSIRTKYVFIPIDSSDCNRQLRLEFEGGMEKRRSVGAVFYGDRLSLVREYLKENILQIGMSLILLIIGILCVLAGIALRIVSKGAIYVDYMGWGLFYVALWNLTRGDFKALLFKDADGTYIIPALSMMFFAMSLISYFNCLQKKRFNRLYSFLVIIDVTIVIVSLLLMALKIMDAFRIIPFSFVMLSLQIVSCFYTIYKDVKNKKIAEYRYLLYGLAGLVLLGIAQMIGFIFDLPYSSSGFCLCFGLLFLMAMSLVQAYFIMKQVNKERDMAMMSAQIKSEFFASMSHEIRTPINAVLGMNEAILRETGESNIRGYAMDVNNAGHLLLSLINDILDFSKLDSGKMKIVEGEYRILSVISSSYLINSPKAENKNLTLNLQVNEKMPSGLIGDATRIEQIVTNILNNAVKYTREGSVSLKFDYEKVSEDIITLIIEVKDTGIGIKKENISKLFNAFERIDEEKNRGIEGTGLGLSITGQLVENMHGYVDVESEYGNGSTFTVFIPQKVYDFSPVGVVNRESLKSKGDDKQAEKEKMFYAPKAKILVVDDIAVNLKVVSSLLKESGIHIDTANSCEKCLEMATSNKYDVILLDHMMPGKDGLETFKELKHSENNLNKEVPVVMLTANAISGAMEEYLEMGFSGYLSKPISLATIKVCLLKFLPPEYIERN